MRRIDFDLRRAGIVISRPYPIAEGTVLRGVTDGTTVQRGIGGNTLDLTRPFTSQVVATRWR